jgi:hypothetical protein
VWSWAKSEIAGDLEIGEPQYGDGTGLTAPTPEVVRHEGKPCLDRDSDPSSSTHAKPDAANQTIAGKLEFPERRLSVRDRRIPEVAARRNGDGVRFIELTRSRIYGDSTKQGSIVRIEAQHLVGEAGRDVEASFDIRTRHAPEAVQQHMEERAARTPEKGLSARWPWVD